MERLPDVTQSPFPGQSNVMYCGDCLTFKLTLSFGLKGSAWIRTNLGSAAVSRQEIINRVEQEEIKLDEAWYDIEMVRVDDLSYRITLPLFETGFFQGKCFFLPDGSSTPVWPQGDNTIINVEPAGTCCANIIYNAFVRQFGKYKSSGNDDKELAPAIKKLDHQGYTVIPESGKFRDLIEQVPFIFSELGCRALHLLPIHPTPTTYARMGRFGSPYAALKFTDVDPALAEFDPKTTPLEQFMELVDSVHYHNGYILLDIAINHTGWAASIHETHPEWLSRDEDGKIEVPGAWGVEWADLTKLDYSNTRLWEYMAQVFLLWCHRGVDGFRCDAGYMIPVDAWEYIVAKVRLEYPQVLFFLEGLGGPIESTRQILGKANFNWAYSELFQNYTSREIKHYFTIVNDLSNSCGHLIHFAETHDNNRLAAVSKTYAKMRTSLCALFSVCGGFGFANGVEWFAKDKIDVHESKSLNWGSSENQVDHIIKLNRVLACHPAFFSQTRMEFISPDDAQFLVLVRHNIELNKQVLVVVNLDCENTQQIFWKIDKTGFDSLELTDLITGGSVTVEKKGDERILSLSKGQVLALTPDRDDLKLLEQNKYPFPQRVYLQKLKAKVLTLYSKIFGYGDVTDIDLSSKAKAFSDDPVEFIRSLNRDSKEARVIVFDIEKDCKRQVMIPPGFFLLVKCRHSFRAQITEQKRSDKVSIGYEESLLSEKQNIYFALFEPFDTKKQHKEFILDLRIFSEKRSQVKSASLLYLAPFENLIMRSTFTRKEIVKTPFLKLLGTTHQGGMMRAAAWWGQLHSRYDALLGANMDPDLPENRWMVLSRCRIWAVYQGYSRELAPDCLETFTFSYDNGGKWLFRVPTSEGKYYELELMLSLDYDSNHVGLAINRLKARKDARHLLDDDNEVNIIVRPDVEDRSFHEPVKAFAGPENIWPSAIEPFEKGFYFYLSNKKLFCMVLSSGRFVHEPEWHYMVYRPAEAQRGLDPDSDLFSPGYFQTACKGGDKIFFNAAVIEPSDKEGFACAEDYMEEPGLEKGVPLSVAFEKGIDAFLVHRGSDKSVIAGYPWFLDWGRDSLIFCRSLIELERFEDARAVLRLFGRFENNGTLPNMICGSDARNIETSDAPLWFFACCKDLVKKENNKDFLDETLNNRTIKEILLSIACAFEKGTPTGVIMDPETFLLYSPSHFTWMDTNFPAGSPRQGYPIEIQAMWYNALTFLAEVDESGSATWKSKAEKVHQSILELFYNENLGFFADCLHSNGPVGAQNADPDDALRPNQLFLFALKVINDEKIAVKCLETCLELIVPGGIRSLADRRVEYPINIFYNEELLKDPYLPYSGEYKGDEDTQRKPAYHNGTAWTWPFPVFCEAWAQVFGSQSHSTCLAWLGSFLSLMRKGAAGYIPEILDGDYPHTPRGCDAQAWGISEAARVVRKLSE